MSEARAISPLLLTEKQAREVLAGANPEDFTPPIRVGRRKFYSTAALDCAVKKRAGLPVDDGVTGESAYDAWKKSCA